MIKRLLFLFCVFLSDYQFGQTAAESQSAESGSRDSLRPLFSVLKNSNDASERIGLLNRIALALSENQIDTSLILSAQALSLSERNQLKIETARTCRLLGHFYNRMSDYPAALKYFYRSLRLFEQLEKEGKANLIAQDKCSAYSGIGIVYDNRGDFPKALEFYLTALKMAEQQKNSNAKSMNLTNIGILYYRQGEFKKALNYLFQSLNEARKTKDELNDAVVLGDIGCVYKDMGETEKALEYLFSALKIVSARNDKRGVTSNLANIGSVYHEKKEFSKAISYYAQALSIDSGLGDKAQIALDIGNMGWVYADMGEYKEAEKYLLKAIELDKQIGAQFYEAAYHEKISELYEMTGRYDEALAHFKEVRHLKDTLYNSEKNNELASREANYLFEKKEAEARYQQEKEISVAEAGKKRQGIIILAAFFGLILIIVFSFFIYKRFRIVQNQKLLIEKQKEIVDEKQKEILDSITYARRIQHSLLPNEKVVMKNLNRLQKN